MFLKKQKPNKVFIDLVNSELSFEDLDNIIIELDKIKLTPFLYRYLKNKNLFIQHKLKRLYQRNSISNMIILDYKKFLEKELQKNNIRHLFYKGVYLIENIYDEIGDRYLGDIDLLIHSEDLHKLKNIFKNEKSKIDKLINDNFFHEIYILTKYKEQNINLDIHKNFFPMGKYPINLDVFFKDNRAEHQLIITIIEINSEFFNDEKRILDLILIIEKQKINWEYFYKLVNDIKINRLVFITLKFINNFFNKNYPLSKQGILDNILLNNVLTFNNKRWNQVFFFFYNFDNFNEYKKFFIRKVKYSYFNKNLYKEIKKFWTEYQ